MVLGHAANLLPRHGVPGVAQQLEDGRLDQGQAPHAAGQGHARLERDAAAIGVADQVHRPPGAPDHRGDHRHLVRHGEGGGLCGERAAAVAEQVGRQHAETSGQLADE